MIPAVSHVRIGELSIAYRRAGRGPALVLLHGFLCDSRIWRTQLVGLADQFSVIAWDAPGAGGSSDPVLPFTLADWARCLAAFLDDVAVGRAHVVGLSWGGILAQEFYRQFPTRVARLVLAGTYAGWRGSLSAAAVQQRLARCEQDASLPPAELAQRWVREMFSPAAPPPLLDELAAVFTDFHPLGFRLMARSSAETDTTDLLPRLVAPTLLLWGGADQRSPIVIAEQFHAAIPGATLRVLPGSGHLSNMEQPEAFNAEVRRFCGAGGAPPA